MSYLQVHSYCSRVVTGFVGICVYVYAYVCVCVCVYVCVYTWMTVLRSH